jgi:hypothetical protein
VTAVSESTETTGHPDVDAAVEAVVSLEERPVAEHLAAYENAHVLLRQALSDTPREPDGESSPAEESDPEVEAAAVPAEADVVEPAG